LLFNTKEGHKQSTAQQLKKIPCLYNVVLVGCFRTNFVVEMAVLYSGYLLKKKYSL